MFFKLTTRNNQIQLIKRILNKQAPWARLFDYYFLIPIKNKQSHKKVFNINLIYNLCIFIIVTSQIVYGIQFLCILSFFLSLMLIYYFKSFDTNNLNFLLIIIIKRIINIIMVIIIMMMMIVYTLSTWMLSKECVC